MVEETHRWECWQPIGGCGKVYKNRPLKNNLKGRPICPACGQWVIQCKVVKDLSGPSATVSKAPVRDRDGQYVA